MRRLVVGFCIFAAVQAANVGAEEPDSQTARKEGPVPVSNDSPHQGGFFPRFRGRALVLEINARVVERNETVIWNESHQKITLPGQPVGIKLVGSNLVVVAQFTPYVRRGVQKFLVAQGQIWMEVPDQGIRYHTTMQTIPLEFGEPIYFFPLGPQGSEDTARIEVMLTLYPYEE
jgi:hypothetical protein